MANYNKNTIYDLKNIYMPQKLLKYTELQLWNNQENPRNYDKEDFSLLALIVKELGRIERRMPSFNSSN